MNHLHDTALAAPEWLLFSLAALFLAGGCFYLGRIVFHKRVEAHYGYIDIENEIGHGLCMTAMATMLAPALLPVSFTVWSWVLGIGSAWFLLRTFTWGRRLHFNWFGWDLIHVAMLGFMALMFTGVTLPVTALYAAGGFWLFFTAYAGYWAWMIRRDGRPAGFLEFGSDAAHIVMGVAMFVMTFWPSLLMPAHSGAHTPAPVVVAPPVDGVVVGTDASFAQEVLNARQPVIVLVFGGCEKCAAEIPVFEQLAAEYAGRVKFVRINKDDSPEACKKLGVTDCPAFVFLSKTSRSNLLKKEVDKAELKQFIEESLKK